MASIVSVEVKDWSGEEQEPDSGGRGIAKGTGASLVGAGGCVWASVEEEVMMMAARWFGRDEEVILVRNGFGFGCWGLGVELLRRGGR